MPSPEKLALIAQMNEGMRRFVPHNRELGLEVLDFRHRTGEVWMRLPYAERLVGNPDDGVLHGGAITSLMDAACGMAVMVRIGQDAAIATLDLRIDYLKPAAAGREVIAHVECFKLTRSVAFVRGVAHAGDAADPIAAVAATFMRKDAS
ncbi:MAG: PaaI family thioesterase [Sandaracinaceae bacterium]|nr:PaaI family thioesterase [Sandaracinaceae bacterium]